MVRRKSQDKAAQQKPSAAPETGQGSAEGHQGAAKPQQEGNQVPPPQEKKPMTIQQRKKHVFETLMNKFSEEVWRTRLLLICGGDESEIVKKLTSFLTYIMKDEGGRNHDVYIADCAIPTIAQCFLESFQMGIEVGGGRDHAYLVNYAGECELEISYKGFVYALSKHFLDPFVMAENVFEGDEFTSVITDTTASFVHKPKDPFDKTWGKLRGCYCYFSYTQRDNKEKVSRLIMIQKTGPDGLEMIKSKAKGSFAWPDFPFEQTKKATLRRAAKIPFASIDFADTDISPEAIDNRRYTLEGNSEDRLQKLMDKQRDLAPAGDKPKEEPCQSDKSTTANASPGKSGTHAKTESSPDAKAAAGMQSAIQEASADSVQKSTADANSQEREIKLPSNPVSNITNTTPQTGSKSTSLTILPEGEQVPGFLTKKPPITDADFEDNVDDE